MNIGNDRYLFLEQKKMYIWVAPQMGSGGGSGLLPNHNFSYKTIAFNAYYHYALDLEDFKI